MDVIIWWSTVVSAIATVAAIPVAILISKQKRGDAEGSRGGHGGSGRIVNGDGIVIGGRGGKGGPPGAGRGGDGGSGTIVGGTGQIIGGEGGEAGQYGRGGRGGRSPIEALGPPDITLPDGRRLSEFGRGGDGAAPPIKHYEQMYELAGLVRKLPEHIIQQVDGLKPKTSQDWWNAVVSNHPDLADKIARQSKAL